MAGDGGGFGWRGEGVGVVGDDACVREDESPEVGDGGGKARAEGGVADGGDLVHLVGDAVEDDDEEGEGEEGGNGQVREGQVIDGEALGGVA